MNFQLHIILIICSLLFFIFIFKMITSSKLNLKYSLTWVFVSFIFLLISIFPKVLIRISALLYIKEPVNAIFLIVIFFLLVISFNLTLALSKKSDAIKDLIQEMGMLELSIEELKSNIDKEKEGSI